MKHWFNKNYKTLIIFAFLIPIITVAIVSISHVTKWYGISNPVSWAIYLSIGIEIAALSALAAISANMGKKVYFPFAVVTLIQFIGNIFFAYTYIDVNSQSFKDWVDLVSPFVEFLGVDPTDFIGHKRFLAFFAGGMLPVISLSFLHMLVKFTEEDRKKEETTDDSNDPNKLKEFVDENVRLRLTEDDLKKLEEALLNPPPPNEALKKAAEDYKKRGELLSEMMQKDQELGLYDEPFDNPMIKEEEENSIIEPTIEEEEQNFSTIESISENIFQDGVKPYQSQIDNINQMLSEVENETFSEKPTTLNNEINAVQYAVENETVPEPFATPEELEKHYTDEPQIDEIKVDEEVEKHYSDDDTGEFKIEVGPINETLDEEKKK